MIDGHSELGNDLNAVISTIRGNLFFLKYLFPFLDLCPSSCIPIFVSTLTAFTIPFCIHHFYSSQTQSLFFFKQTGIQEKDFGKAKSHCRILKATHHTTSLVLCNDVTRLSFALMNIKQHFDIAIEAKLIESRFLDKTWVTNHPYFETDVCFLKLRSINLFYSTTAVYNALGNIFHKKTLLYKEKQTQFLL